MRVCPLLLMLALVPLPAVSAQAQVVSALPGLSAASAPVLAKPSQGPSDDPQTIRDKLKQRISVDWRRIPLEQALTGIGRELGVAVHLDPEGLEEAGVVKDQIIDHVAGKERRGDHLLNLTLEPLNLTYVVRHGAVIVTSDEKAGEQLTTRAYNVRDLLTPWPPKKPLQESSPIPVPPGTKVVWQKSQHQFGDEELEDVDTLLDLVTMIVAADSWTDNGGTGSISVFRGLLVVSQTEAVHEEVELLLRQLSAGERSRPGEVIHLQE